MWNVIWNGATSCEFLLYLDTKPDRVGCYRRCVTLKWVEKKYCWKSRRHVPQCSVAGDTNEWLWKTTIICTVSGGSVFDSLNSIGLMENIQGASSGSIRNFQLGRPYSPGERGSRESRRWSPPEGEAVCRHCLQILTAETIKFCKFCTLHLLILSPVCFMVGSGG